MQEYGILIQKQLNRGLRPFRAGPLLEDIGLIECKNLMPSETGLIGHDPLLPIGIPSVGFQYLGIYDQSQTIWYWTINYDGNLEIWNRIPTHEIYDVISTTPIVIPWWWPIVDELDTIWYLYPNIATGQPILDTTQPTQGVSTLPVDFKLRTIFFEFWRMHVDSTPPTFYSRPVLE
jgi:hypothetical protein